MVEVRVVYKSRSLRENMPLSLCAFSNLVWGVLQAINPGKNIAVNIHKKSEMEYVVEVTCLDACSFYEYNLLKTVFYILSFQDEGWIKGEKEDEEFYLKVAKNEEVMRLVQRFLNACTQEAEGVSIEGVGMSVFVWNRGAILN